MNLDQTLSLARSLLKLFAGALVAKGWGDNSTWEAVAGGVVAIIGLVWSHFTHLDKPAPTQSPGGVV